MHIVVKLIEYLHLVHIFYCKSVLLLYIYVFSAQKEIQRHYYSMHEVNERTQVYPLLALIRS